MNSMYDYSLVLGSLSGNLEHEAFDKHGCDLLATPWSVVRSDSELYVGNALPADLLEFSRLYR